MMKFILMLSCLVLAQDKTIKPEDAGKFVDKEVTVKMKVKSAKLLAERELCFLNSKKDHRDKDNFSIVIKGRGLKSFKAVSIDDPAKHFEGKTILIKGTVETFREKVQIELKSSDQIKIVETKGDKEKEDDSKKDEKEKDGNEKKGGKNR